MSPRTTSVILLITSLWLAPVLQSEPILMPPVIVEASAPTKSEIRQLAGAGSILDVSIRPRGASPDLATSLVDVPGLYARSRNQSGQTRLSIRGSGLARNADVRGLALQWNGLPLNVADADFDYLTAIEPLNLAQIKVIRSANMSEAATQNLGGALDFLSHTGTSAPGVSLRSEFGSNDYYRQHAAGGWQSQQTDGYTAIDHLQTEGFREQSGQERLHLEGNVGWRSDTWENRIEAIRVQSREELPGALTDRQSGLDSTSAARSANPLFDRVKADWQDEIEWNRLADRFHWQGDEQNLSAGLWFSTATIRNPRNEIFDNNYHDVGLRWRWEKEWAIGSAPQTTSITLTPAYAWASESDYVNRGGGVRGNLLDSTDREWANTDLYWQQRWTMSEAWTLVGALQGSYALRSISDQTVQPGEAQTNDTVDFYNVNPSLGLLWHWHPSGELYLNYARSSEAPTMNDLYQQGGANFLAQKVQEADTVEFGQRGQIKDWSWEASLYQSWLNNEFLISETFPGSGQSVTRSTPHSTHRGFEAMARWDYEISSSTSKPETAVPLSFSLNYLWSDFQLKDDPLYGNQRLPGVPEHLWQLTGTYRHTSGFYLTPRLLWQPVGIGADYAGTLSSDAATVIGLKTGYEHPQGWWLFVEVQNVSNEQYAGEVSTIADARSTDQRVFWPGAGRAYYAGLGWRW